MCSSGSLDRAAKARKYLCAKASAAPILVATFRCQLAPLRLLLQNQYSLCKQNPRSSKRSQFRHRLSLLCSSRSPCNTSSHSSMSSNSSPSKFSQCSRNPYNRSQSSQLSLRRHLHNNLFRLKSLLHHQYTKSSTL